ncbi:hypothetical protein HY485_01605 [Candidatus Woesearchaeota archaeon]|nr:hypothetical protein [Candidatus Woesearchaeota archaeon]
MRLTVTRHGIFVLIIVGLVLISGCVQVQEPQQNVSGITGQQTQQQNKANISAQPKFQLDVPDGALPEEASIEDIRLNLVDIEEIPEKWKWLEGDSAFRLEPDGIEFKEPVTVTITAPAQDGTIPRLYLVNEENAEELKDVQVSFNPVTQTVTAVAKLSHFSTIIYRKKASVKTVLERGASGDSPPGVYFKECLETFKIMEKLCQTYENWYIDHVVSVTDFVRKQENSYEDVRNGPNNKCGRRAGDKYPLSITSKHLMGEKSASDSANPDKTVNIEVTCQSSCFGWKCPAGEEELEKNFTCTGINMYKDVEACTNSKWCKSRQCVRDQTQFDCWTCVNCPAGDPTDICVRNCGLKGGICREVSPGCSVCETCSTGTPTASCTQICGEIGGTCKQVSTTPDCSVCCTPKWSCTAFSPNSCPASGVQTRTCRDTNNCGTTSGKPAESQRCTPEPTCDTGALGLCLSGNCLSVYGPGGSANCPEQCKINDVYDDTCLSNQCNVPYKNCIAACHTSNPPCTVNEVYAVLETLSR